MTGQVITTWCLMTLAQVFCLFACMLAGLRKNYLTDFHETLGRGDAWVINEVIKFCGRSDYRGGYKKKIHCLAFQDMVFFSISSSRVWTSFGLGRSLRSIIAFLVTHVDAIIARRGVLSDVFVAGVDCSSERPLMSVEEDC